MATNRVKHVWNKSFHLHHMNDCDDLNFYYKKFLNKLSKICLKIFLPLLLLIYLFTLFLCRLFLSNQTKFTFDIRTSLFLIFIFLNLILLIFIRVHTKWRNIWILTRLLLVFLLIIPLIITYQTEQFHVLLATISIILVYSLLTFTLIQSLCISSSISILHIILLLNQKNQIQWKNSELFSIIFYHFIINIYGLYSYIESIKHIRQHFHAYKTNLYEKNKFNVDCKKLNIIISYCQQPQHSIEHSFNNKSSVNQKSGTVIYCNISLNEQTRIHTCDELASLIDILYCQIEQLIIKTQPEAYYIFDNETIVITLINENNNEQSNIDNSCRLAIELFRFIQHVNNITQWCLTIIIGIDYNQLNIYSSAYIQGAAYEYSRWLCNECVITNRIHISSRIYKILKENQSYEFHSYSLITNNLTYLLFNINMYEPFGNCLISINTSDMIDQLTRIQAEYHVEKHLGTVTLMRSLRKRSLFQLTSKYIHWVSLNFKEKYLTKDFQLIHRTNRPTIFIYILLLLILIGSLLQSYVIDHFYFYNMILFPIVIISLVLFIIIFHYSIRTDNSQLKLDFKNRKFNVYLNILICLTLSILIFVAIQYHSIQNFKYLFISKKSINQTIKTISNRLNSTLDEAIISEPSSFDRQYHEYLVLTPIYPLYFCTLFRQCSWIIKTFFILICSILQLYILEYIWLTTNTYLPSIHSLHHYTTFTLILFHNLLLILSSYVREWLEKIDFIWLKQIDNERLMVIRQRNELIQQTSSSLPLRVINYYLNTNSNLSLTQHYHFKYDHMGLLYIRFDLLNNQDEYLLIDLINNIEYLLKTNDQYRNIVMHRKSTVKEMIFSMDLNNSMKSLQQLIELLFQINEYLKQISQIKISLTACLHIACVHEILIHLEKYPKIDIWSEQISLMELLISKIQVNHCLTTTSVYHLLNDLYLFRTAGSIINTQMNMDNNTNIYYLLGRLIGDNVFQGRNALPLTISQSNNDTIQKSSSTDDSQPNYKHNSQKEKNPTQTSSSTTTTTSSSGVPNDQQSLLKQSTRKHVRVSNSYSSQPSYRHTLLKALNPTINDPHQISPMKKLPKLIHSNENTSRSLGRDAVTTDSKCLILTQGMLNGSTDDNNQCSSTPPPISNHRLSFERKSFIEDDFHQLSKDLTNEETTSAFSGWDDSPSPSANIEKQESVKHTPSSPTTDGYYPHHLGDLSFTVNMSTTEDVTDTKSTVIHSSTSTVVAIPSQISKYRPRPFNLARKLIAETSESEISVEHQDNSWTQNIAYRSKNLQRTRLSSSYNNLNDSLKYHPKQTQPSSIFHTDLLQRWLEDQLNQFRCQIKQTPPLLRKKSNRFSTIDIINNDSTDDESDTLQENTYPILTTKKSTKRPYHHVRYKPLKKNSASSSHLIRHESLKHKNRPLLFENNHMKKILKRTDSSSMPRSDLSDISSSRPDNLSEGILSNLESEYDNMYTQDKITTIMSNSQILTDDDDDDETTLATTINRCYF